MSGNLLITITREAGANAVLNGLFIDGVISSGSVPQSRAGSSLDTGFPSSPATVSPQIADGSSGGLAIGQAVGPVDAVLGALPDDTDAQTSPIRSVVHDLAVEQIRQSRRRPRE